MIIRVNIQDRVEQETDLALSSDRGIVYERIAF